MAWARSVTQRSNCFSARQLAVSASSSSVTVSLSGSPSSWNGLEARRPCQLSLVRTQVTHDHGRDAVAEGRVGQQDITQPACGAIQGFEALDVRTAVSARQRTPSAYPLAHNRAINDHGEILAGRTEVAAHLPDSINWNA
jgi:hypothetical protein